MKNKIVFLAFLLGIICLQCTKEAITLYTIGDSTMADKKTGVYPETGWCQVLPQYFDESVTVENHAVNGRSSKSFIDEGRWQRVLDVLEEGDYVFIQFGHNDEKEYDTTRYTVPYGSFYENMLRFVNESRAKGAIPVLFTPIVRRKFNEDNTLSDTHGEYPDAVRDLASEQGVPLIDLQKLTGEWVESLGEENSRQMYVWTEPSESYPDGRKDDTHLSEEGAKKVAEIAVGELKPMELKLSKRIN